MKSSSVISVDDCELQPRHSFSPAEFANLHGKSKTWAYRLMYAGKLRVIKGAGTIRIPRAEAERFCQNVEVYQGRVVQNGKDKTGGIK